MNKRIVYLILSAALAVTFLFSTGMTFAAWTTQGDTINKVSIAQGVKGQIVEEYEQGQTVYPAGEVNKVVQVKNTGTVDSAVRVKVEKAWGDGRDEDGKLLVNPDLSTDNIVIQYNETDWYYKESDGYYYYKGTLSPEEITPALLSKFTLDEPMTGTEYRGKHADVIVTMEMIQAAGNSLTYWNTSYEELGVVYEENKTIEIVTTVDFESPTSGFKFEKNDGDLFANFGDMVPGECRSQMIEVTNKWNEKTEISLWAEIAEQTQATEETREAIEKLLKEYAQIIVSDENGMTIYTGPVWGNLDTETRGTDTMKYPYVLGEFSPKETKEYYVNISLDPQMGNEYAGILGQIKWCFSARGIMEETPTNATDAASNSDAQSQDKPQYTTTTPVKTGTDNGIMVYVILMILSAIALCVMVFLIKKENRAKN